MIIGIVHVVKDMHEVTVFTNWRFDLFWKITGFSDACSGIFTEILNPVLEFLLKIENLKVGISTTSLIWKFSLVF